MLRKEQNDLLTQTGPGTQMGQMFRLSWQPALLAEELPEPGCPPVRVKLLSERLLAWRDSNGKLALTDEFCAHRGVSLWFGRNEHGGLRCPYHGWKYDHTGQCIEVPSEPSESGYCQKVKLKSYPLIERGGVLWTYMGPPEKQPPLPEWEFATVPADYAASYVEASPGVRWLQAMEGGIDSSHVSFLHSGELNTDPLFKGSKGNAYNLGDMKPHFEVVESPGGLYIGARRNAENGSYYWQVTQWVMPAFHDDPAPRRPSGAWAFLGVDRRPELLGLELRLQGNAPAVGERAQGDGRTARASMSSYVPGTYIPAAQQVPTII